MQITFDPTNVAEQKVVMAFIKLCGQQPEADMPAGCRQTTLNEAITVEAVVVDDKPKRTRRTKEQIAADEAAARAEEAAKVDVVAPVSAVAETEIIKKPVEAPAPEVKSIAEHLADAQKPVPTKEEVIAKFQALVAKFGKDVATEKARVIINNLGAANISGIPEEKRALAIAQVEMELAA